MQLYYLIDCLCNRLFDIFRDSINYLILSCSRRAGKLELKVLENITES